MCILLRIYNGIARFNYLAWQNNAVDCLNRAFDCSIKVFISVTGHTKHIEGWA